MHRRHHQSLSTVGGTAASSLGQGAAEPDVRPDVWSIRKRCPPRRWDPDGDGPKRQRLGDPEPDVEGPRNGGWLLAAEGEEPPPDVAPPHLEGPETDVHPRLLVLDSDTDVEEEEEEGGGSHPDVAPETPPRPGPRLGGLLVESDTDVEEDGGSADVGPPVIQMWPPERALVMETPEADVGAPRGPDSDTEVEDEELTQCFLPHWQPPAGVVLESPIPDVSPPSVPRASVEGGGAEAAPNGWERAPKCRSNGGGGPSRRGDLVAPGADGKDPAPDVATPSPDVTPNPAVATPNPDLRTPNPDVRAPDPDVATRNPDVVTPNPDMRAPNPDVATPNPDVATPNPAVATPNPAVATPNPDVRAPNPDVATPNPDMKTPNPDMRAPNPDMRAPNPAVATPIPDVRAPNPDVATPNPDVASANADIKAPTAYVATPNPDVKAPNPDMRTPNPDVATPNPDMKTPNPDVRAPDPDVATPNPDVATPNPDMRTPNPDIRAPSPAVATPNPDVRTPNPDVASPNADAKAPTAYVATPSPDVRVPGPDVATPNPDVAAPNPDVAAPNPDVKAPNADVCTPDPDVATPDPDVRTPNPDVPAPTPDVDPQGPDGKSPVPRDASTPKSPHLDSCSAVAHGAHDPESDSDDVDLFLEPTQSFLPPADQGSPHGWDPEEPTQLFCAPQEEEEEEEEEEPPPNPPQAPPKEGSKEEGPRRSQRLARSRRGGAKGGVASVEEVMVGGAPLGPASLRRSPRLLARSLAEPPPPPPKPRPRRAGTGQSRRRAQQVKEEEPREVEAPQLRPRRNLGSSPLKVLFTGLVASEAMEEALGSLGGSVATSVLECTHLVTDRVRRTIKFLCAVARGVPIVTPEWLQKSATSGRILAPDPFLVQDRQQEQHFGFSLAQALQRARRHPLLQGYEIHVTPSVRPEPEHMKDIITCSGGTFLPTMPSTYRPRCVVVSCPADSWCWAPALSSRLPLASPELLLTGLLRQRLQLQPFLLPHTSPPHTRNRRRPVGPPQ